MIRLKKCTNRKQLLEVFYFRTRASKKVLHIYRTNIGQNRVHPCIFDRFFSSIIMQMSINKSPAWYFIVQTILPTQILWYSVAYRQTGWTIFVVIQRKKIVNILTKIFFSCVFSTLYSLKIDLSCRAKVAGTWKNPRHPPLFVFVLPTHYVFIESEMTCHSNSYFS